VREWFVYIVENASRLLYTGVTTEPDRRVQEHNGTTKGARYTRGKGPWRIVYIEPEHTKVSALKREHVIKRLRRERKLELIRLNPYQAKLSASSQSDGAHTS
jgi:putative endonuclease